MKKGFIAIIASLIMAISLPALAQGNPVQLPNLPVNSYINQDNNLVVQMAGNSKPLIFGPFAPLTEISYRPVKVNGEERFNIVYKLPDENTWRIVTQDMLQCKDKNGAPCIAPVTPIVPVVPIPVPEVQKCADCHDCPDCPVPNVEHQSLIPKDNDIWAYMGYGALVGAAGGYGLTRIEVDGGGGGGGASNAGDGGAGGDVKLCQDDAVCIISGAAVGAVGGAIVHGVHEAVARRHKAKKN